MILNSGKVHCLQMFPMYHGLTFTLQCFVLFHMKMIALKPLFSCLDPLPHLHYCRTECCQKQTDELKKERKPFIQLSEHIACHLCATFPHGQCLAAPDSHPAPANHRTWPWAAGLTLWEALGVNVWDRASTRCFGCTCLSSSPLATTQFPF